MIAETPCEHCDDLKTERETGAAYCAVTTFGDFVCDEALSCNDLCEFAGQASCLIRNFLNDDDRDAVADGVCSVLDGALAAHGVRFNGDVFLGWCNATRESEQ